MRHAGRGPRRRALLVSLLSLASLSTLAAWGGAGCTCSKPKTAVDDGEAPVDARRAARAKGFPKPSGAPGRRTYPVHANLLTTVF